ncbi:MAG: cytochrome c [bacterium]|nr:cytochrome c [bacterium]
MRWTSIVGAALLAAAGGLGAWGAAAGGAQSDPNVTVSVTYPPERQMFKDGEGAGLARANCQICHSSDYVYTQPPLTKAQWAAEVTKMKRVYGANIQDGDVDAIAAYLVTQNGRE